MNEQQPATPYDQGYADAQRTWQTHGLPDQPANLGPAYVKGWRDGQKVRREAEEQGQ